jgi:GNAT superfamily N-acetyltransferase
VTIELITLHEPNAVFYAALGPILGNPAAEKELGAPIYHREGKTWIVALQRGDPRAWSAVFLNLHNPILPAEFGSAFVLPDWRGKGYYRAMIEKRLELVGNREVQAIANPAAVPALTSYGFRSAGMEGDRQILLRPAVADPAGHRCATLGNISVLRRICTSCGRRFRVTAQGKLEFFHEASAVWVSAVEDSIPRCQWPVGQL